LDFQIVNEAFVLAMHMSLQRSRLQITYPDIGKEVNTPEIESMPPYGEGDVDNGIVAFVINPGLTKWGENHSIIDMILCPLKYSWRLKS
jgi:hypothetical protein